MAEGLLRHLSRGMVQAESAGVERTAVRPLAVEAMREIGIDVSHQTSKTLDAYLDQHFDAVVTVCDAANEACPYFSNAAQRLHWSFPDPSRAGGTHEEQLQCYRTVRDGLRRRIEAELMPALVGSAARRPRLTERRETLRFEPPRRPPLSEGRASFPDTRRAGR